MSNNKILVGKGEAQQFLNLKYANRHGLVAGATGTGKTVTLKILAEGFSKAGVPVFFADVKGDLAGTAVKGNPHPKIDERIEKIGITDFELSGNPCIFWDLYGQNGHKVKTTLEQMGPLLLARLLDLNETQEGVLTIAFVLAKDENMPLLDLKDLRSLLIYISDNYKDVSAKYGNVSSRSVGSIQRKLLQLEQQGVDNFFGEPALNLNDFMRCDRDGKGYINILSSEKLINSPKLYSTMLLWLLSELFEQLPERGDADKPELVFFFDEAHLLFEDAPKILLDKIEQVVRLIRSKGVGVYFVTQSPLDIPVDVLGQLGNRFQHALRAFTPKDKKAVKAAADTFRQNPKFDCADKITQLGVGEALVSTLDDDGVPTIVDETLIRPPTSRMAPISTDERRDIMADSPVRGMYDKDIDRESAHEILQKRNAELAKQRAEAEAELQKSPLKKGRKSTRMSIWQLAIRRIISSLSSRLVTRILRSVLGR